MMDETEVSQYSTGDGPERKKLKLSQDGAENIAVEETDGTLEYDLDDSGLEFAHSGCKLMKENTVEYDIEHQNGNDTGVSGNDSGISSDEKPSGSGINVGNGVTTPTGGPTALNRIESVQRDAVIISNIIPHANINELYQNILSNRQVKNRVDLVTNELLENVKVDDREGGSKAQEQLSEGLFSDVAAILEKHPKFDPSLVYDLLESVHNEPDRVKIVLAKITGKSETGLEEADNAVGIATDTNVSVKPDSTSASKTTPFSDPEFKNNPLYKDMKTLVKVLPTIDPNEVYAYLEAHYDKPNRVQIVIDELTKSESQESLPLENAASLGNEDRGKAPQTAEDKLQADLKELKDIFRDCDPSFLHEKLVMLHDDGERVQKIAADLFERREYPKLKDVLEEEKKAEDRRKITDMKFDLDVFLSKFPDPGVYFDDIERVVNQSYKDHAIVYMKNTYPQLKAGYLKKVLTDKNHHLVPAVKSVEDYLITRVGHRGNKTRAAARDTFLEYPEPPDEPFFQEVLYYQHMEHIIDHLEEKRQLHQMKVSLAQENGELMECGCCFDDECLFEDMAACGDGHLFCKECICRSVEAAVGDGKTNFLCLTGSCELVFPLQVLQDVLTPPMFSLALRKIQEEEIRQADIPDLVSCPFCTFATIMPDEHHKVFYCLNPECLRESCRSCKEPNHVPLRCEEVEKGGVTSLRTFIETKVSESMLRTCPNCKKRFYKVDGCNKMTCTCGTTMCYVCREPNIDYDHFDNEENDCDIDSDVSELHKTEMMTAAEKARDEYLGNHPDVDPESLNIDLHKLIADIVKNDNSQGYDDDGYDDDDDGDYDD